MNNKQVKLIKKALKARGININSEYGRRMYKGAKKFISNKAEVNLVRQKENQIKK